MIIGITGPNAAGKTEVARMLVKKGYKYHSLSDAIREETTRRNLPHTRENLINIGNELREAFGPGVWAKQLAEHLEDNSIVDSIRHPAEVAELRKHGLFILFCINAPIELRYERAKQRGRLGDGEALDDFRAKEEKEKSDDINKQQLHNVMVMADHLINNDGTLEQLKVKLDGLLAKL